MIDFSMCPLGEEHYDGSDEKRCIIYDGSVYMIKMANPMLNSPGEFSLGTVNEDLGSKIFKILGFTAQDTLVGTYNGKPCVACKDMRYSGGVKTTELHPMRWYALNFWEASEFGKIPSLERLHYIWDNHPQLSVIREQAMRAYFQILVVDALLGNFDRHWGNFGYLDNNGDLSVAPVYDCGSSLFPQLAEKDLDSVLKSEEELDMRVFKFPTMALKYTGEGKLKKWPYAEFLNSGIEPGMNEALVDVYSRIDIGSILSCIHSQEGYSDLRKETISRIVQARYDKLLTPAVNRIVEQMYVM